MERDLCGVDVFISSVLYGLWRVAWSKVVDCVRDSCFDVWLLDMSLVDGGD